MKRRLFWIFCLVLAIGTVSLFYLIGLAVDFTEEDMSHLSVDDRATLREWGHQAELLYRQGDTRSLNSWIDKIKEEENTWVAVAGFSMQRIAGDDLQQKNISTYNIGRNVDWKIHLYFKDNPVMEIPFQQTNISLLVELPQRMRPGGLWPTAHWLLQVVMPLILLILLCYLLYQYIMSPLAKLQNATQAFTDGRFDVRVREQLGRRDDEISALAQTFDGMAERIGELIINQRQLIADLSHEMRTPLARLDIAIECLFEDDADCQKNLERVQRESRNIRKLVDDTLTLAWLENEKPSLQQENVELVDLLDVLVNDARFEFHDRQLNSNLPNTAVIENSNHQALGQAIENILRNALRYTPAGQSVDLYLQECPLVYELLIADQGPGVIEKLLEKIFEPFYRVDKSRQASGNSFGLGLALAKRQIEALGGHVFARNAPSGGLNVFIRLPKLRS